MAASSFALSWIWLFLLSGAGAVPMGGSPLPADPVLSAIAPEECLLYAAYAGQQAASAESSNQTEQLFAEPQVQRFFAEVESQVMKAVRKNVGPAPQQQALLQNLPPLLTLLVTRPSALYVEEVSPAPGGVTVEAGVVISAGDQRAAVEKAVANLLAAAGPQAPQFVEESLAGLTWRRAALPPQAPPLRWAWKGNYLLLAVGPQTPAKLVERMEGDAPQWLDKGRAAHREVERELSFMRLDVAGILNRVQPIVAQQNPEAWPIAERLGLTSIRELTARNGYDGSGCISSTLLNTGGQRPGVLALMPHEPLQEQDLAPVPRDALLAMAVRLNPSQLWDDVMGMVVQFHPEAEAEADRGLMDVKNRVGIDVRKDIVDSLGDAWIVYLPGGDLMSSWLNAAVAVRVKDPQRLDRAMTKLCVMARTAVPEDEAALVESRVGNHTLYTVQFLRNPAPISPAWCVSDEWFVAGLLPQAVRSVVERQPAESLAAAPSVAAALSAEGGAAVLGYQDTQRLVQSFYPWLQAFAQMAAGQLRKEGIEIDPSIVPTMDVIARHMRPSVSTWSFDGDGFRSVARGSLPTGGGPAAVGFGTGLLLPAVQAARDAARWQADLNNMKQISLGILNYESAFRTMPQDIVAEDGTPLLSWRVAILPFVEEQALYEQLRRDEPWNSPHNAQVLAAAGTPAVYQSNSDPSPPGTTRFLGLKGPGTIFEGARKLTFAGIRDGTSQTVAFVQVEPGAAIEWAKPADLPFDPAQPKRGLSDPRGFAAAWCDGSVRRVAATIADEVLVKLSTRAGGELIEWDSIPSP
ncbi:MAG: DUF1559 domain-containing protein [Pirellulales bacterium]|nr:DUF1559 domain-containing protein [Pirellulales bacterium]